MLTPVGLTYAQSCAAIRAGLNGFCSYPNYETLLPEPALSDAALAIVAAIPTLAFDLSAQERLMALAIAPMAELIETAGLGRRDFSQTAIAFCLSPANPEFAINDKLFGDEFLNRLGLVSCLGHKCYKQAHASAMYALRDLNRLIASEKAAYGLLVGADSYIDYASLVDLDQQYRLKSERNRDGFIPGESSVSLVLESESHAQARGATVLGYIDSIGIGVEKNTLAGDRVSSCQGLGDAVEMSHSANIKAYDWVICDLNGESYRSQEWGMFSIRCSDYFPDVSALWHPASSVGDVGAASGAMSIATALHAFEKDYAPSKEAFVWGASDNGERGVCVISAPITL